MAFYIMAPLVVLALLASRSEGKVAEFFYWLIFAIVGAGIFAAVALVIH